MKFTFVDIILGIDFLHKRSIKESEKLTLLSQKTSQFAGQALAKKNESTQYISETLAGMQDKKTEAYEAEGWWAEST